MATATKKRRIARTVAVKITSALSEAIENLCEKEREPASSIFAPELHEWSKKLALKAMQRFEKTEPKVQPRGTPRRDASIRLQRIHVTRINIVSAITGRSASEMFEEKLWELVKQRTTKSFSRGDSTP